MKKKLAVTILAGTLAFSMSFASAAPGTVSAEAVTESTEAAVSDAQAAADDLKTMIDGGPGVGRVTRPGLDQPVGNAAINHVPREMILREVTEVC